MLPGRSAAPFQPGPEFQARYRLIRRVGSGGFGTVFEAQQLQLSRRVAVKFLHPHLLGNAAQTERFVREARLMARLSHPVLVTLFDADVTADVPFLVTAFVEGETLAVRLARPGALALSEVTRLFVQLLEGLAYVHGEGFLHRDLKPLNVMMTPEGELRLLDLGLALDVAESRRLTLAGYQLGTPAYMAPEQLLFDAVGVASDLYAAGLILYEMLTGWPAFRETDPREAVAQKSRGLGPLELQRLQHAGPGIGEVLRRLLDAEPGKRYRSASETREALVAGLGPDLSTAAGRTDRQRGQPRSATREQVGRSSLRTQPEAAVSLLGRWPIVLLLVALVTVLAAAHLFLWEPEARPGSQTVPAHASIVRPPQPATGDIQVSSRPPGARILGQDGSDTGRVTPALLPGLAPGSWNFVLELTGHAPTPVSVPAVAGQTCAVEVTLAPGLVPLGKNEAGYETYRNAKDGTILIAVPGGSFDMGADDLNGSEDQVHRVTLSPYAIGTSEVTWKQYLGFCKATRHKPPDKPGWGIRENHPVVSVSWLDADAYCRWADLRLPTEAEWEYAARGNDGRHYPWGNQPPDARRARFGEFMAGTSPVGAHPLGVSPFGAHDMAGNAWEWCSDWKDDYPPRPVTNPQGPDHGRERVLRGGSWLYDASYLRADYRKDSAPAFRYDFNGFRCAR